MDNKRRLAYAIVRFLHDQLRNGGLSADAQESLEGEPPTPTGGAYLPLGYLKMGVLGLHPPHHDPHVPPQSPSSAWKQLLG